MLLQVKVNDASKAVVVVCFLLVLLLRKVYLGPAQIVLGKHIELRVLDFVLFLEELALGLCSNGVFLNSIPQIFVVEEVLPFGFLE